MTEETQQEEKSLDDLISEFGDDKPKAEPQKIKPEDFSRVVNFVDRAEVKEAQGEIDLGLNEAVDYLKEDDSIKATDRVLRGLVYAVADENPSIKTAFENRAKNPSAWNKAKELIRTEAAKDFTIDSKTTDDIAAATASAKGLSETEPDTSSKKPSSADFNNMSDVDFEKWKQVHG